MEYKEYTGKNVSLLTCSDCNTNCKHCYITFDGCFSGENLLNIVSKLRQSRYAIDLNGSEPLLHYDYLDAFSWLGQTRVMSNGLVFSGNYKYLDTLRDCGITTINTSFHFSFHETISSVPRAFLFELWKEIKLRGMFFTINCTISTKNYMDIHSICEEAYGFGAKRIRFTNLLRHGRATMLNDTLFLNSTQLNDVIENIYLCRNLFSPAHFYIERCGSFGRGEKGRKFLCPAGVNHVYIPPNGMVYPCAFLTSPGQEIGYMKDGKIYVAEQFHHNGQNCLALSALNHRQLKRE